MPISIASASKFSTKYIIPFFNAKLPKFFRAGATTDFNSDRVEQKPQNAVVPRPFSNVLDWLDGPIGVLLMNSSPRPVVYDYVCFRWRSIFSGSSVLGINAGHDFEQRRFLYFIDLCRVVTYNFVLWARRVPIWRSMWEYGIWREYRVVRCSQSLYSRTQVTVSSLIGDRGRKSSCRQSSIYFNRRL